LGIAVDQDTRILLASEHGELPGKGALPGPALLADQCEDLHLGISEAIKLLTYEGIALKSPEHPCLLQDMVEDLYLRIQPRMSIRRRIPCRARLSPFPH
jgi:hypothetical protein